MGLRNQRFAGVVFGILVVEDLFAVLLMVLLSTVAVSKHVEGMEMLDSVVKLGIFLLFCFVVGIYLIPSFLKKAKSFLNEGDSVDREHRAMPWYGYDRHKSRILIGSRSFYHGFYFGRDH